MSPATVTLQIAGEQLLLHPQRAVLWPARRTVIVADTHFGKSSLFRRHGLAVPAGSDEQDRQRLHELLRSTAAQRLVVLGDFLHGPIDAASSDAQALGAWSGELRSTEICVIAGNHDRGAAPRWLPPVKWQEGDLIEPPFRFTHDAGRVAAAAAVDGHTELFTLSGHVHPVIRIRGLRKLMPRIPVFWQRSGGLVLPSFGVFTGGFVVSPDEGDRLFAAGPERVVRFR